MQRTTFIAIIAPAAIGVTTIAAMANNRGPDFSTLDTDGNGEITMQEIQNSAQARFQAADTDGDGFLTQAELEVTIQDRSSQRSARMIERMDANNDGKLSAEEMQDRRRNPARFFDRMDADNSGGISQDEFEEARARVQDRRGNNKNKN